MTHFYGSITTSADADNRPFPAGRASNGSFIWQAVDRGREMRFCVSAGTMAGAVEQNAALFLHGSAASRDRETLPPQKSFAAELLRHYRKHGELPIDRLDGSFTCAVFDSAKRRAILYRNLVGADCVYYAQRRKTLYFGSNLAKLASQLPDELSPNRRMVPVLFRYRTTFGRETLFDDVFRLMPGEILVFDDAGLSVTQRTSFADFEADRIAGASTSDRLEETMARVIRDCAAIDPRTVNLLSGGVDSSYMQAVWNHAIHGVNGRPVSVAATVDHPRTIPDRDYARSAAEFLGTAHREYPANDPYMSYLVAGIAATGELPNHVQTAYFTTLAKELAKSGVESGLCGEGADSLLGTDWCRTLTEAAKIRQIVPTSFLQRTAATVLKTLGSDTRWQAFFYASILDDDRHEFHPLNQAAAYGHRESVQACFRKEEIDFVREYLRELVRRYRIAPDLLSRVHAVAFLVDAVQSTSIWKTIFAEEGIAMRFPFMDSRVLRLATNMAPDWRFSPETTKRAVKEALARYMPREIVDRPKLSWGQPIFEWLAPGGQLRSRVERIGNYDFVPPATLETAKAKPNWFLYSLLCYDVWHKLFIEKADAM
jgi:asparagine synthase (glutamine-hydrolysing)